jgi:hypothetical protein
MTRISAHALSREETDFESPYLGSQGLGLLSVNHQILEEAGPVLYGAHFAFEKTSALFLFLRCIGPSKKRSMKTIMLDNYTLEVADRDFRRFCCSRACQTSKMWSSLWVPVILATLDLP